MKYNLKYTFKFNVEYKVKFILGIMAMFYSVSGFTQVNQVNGSVYETNAAGERIPLIAANVQILGGSNGTITDENGQFSMALSGTEDQLVVSYMGYNSDTVRISGGESIEIGLKSMITLDQVKVVYRKNTNEVSLIDPIKIEQISEGELRKAACCNLSESFETSPSVDVSFTDAITGTRQIKMLGLAGSYAQITTESMPFGRGLSAIRGLVYIPGTWVEGMQLNKGTGSVLNGYESMTGQINIEMKKPENMIPLYANAYADEGGRLEANLNLAHQFSSKLSSAVLLHGKRNGIKHDRNGDGFLDQSLGEHFILMNRWKYIPNDRWRFQAGVKSTIIDNVGGQVNFDKEEPDPINGYWGMTSSVRQLQAWAKVGLLSNLPWKSMGLQLSIIHHDEENQFGAKNYDANQTSLYGNYIFQTILWNTQHEVKTGLSVQYDKFDEILVAQQFGREEVIPGIYGEYSYLNTEDFSIVMGMRVDHHNQYGYFATPRLHMRKMFGNESVLRASMGRGQRTASVIAENFGGLASARQWQILGTNNDNPYGLEPEVAWNYGVNYTLPFQLDYKYGSVSVDVYRTDFVNRVVLDYDADPQAIQIYNVEGDSYSNTVQIQANYALFRNLDVRAAYRWVDSQVKYRESWRELPLYARHRAFFNMAYTTDDESWKFDATVNWQGSKRLPTSVSNPVEYQWVERSPSFFVMNAQVSKSFLNGIDVYIGVENLLNYRQEKAIIASEDPLGQYFDASMIWGPVLGRNTYIGMRYSLSSK